MAKAVKKQKKQSSQVGIFVIIFAIVIVILIAANKNSGGGTSVSRNTYVPKPNVYVGDSKWEFKLGLSKGYYGMFNGFVINSGDASAENVRVICSVRRDGRSIGSEELYVGNLAPSQSQLFEMEVDFRGGDEASGSCTATCSNC